MTEGLRHDLPPRRYRSRPINSTGSSSASGSRRAQQMAKPTRNDLTAEFVQSILGYDPETGTFRWRPRSNMRPQWNARYAGKIAGTVQSKGYWLISIDNRGYLAHRLAWLWVYCDWPPDQIDHIDGDKLNNSIANLRLATNTQNQTNKPAPRSNTSGFKGVTWSKKDQRWAAQIKKGGKKHHLGHFDTPEEAHAAYVAAATETFGEFARTTGETHNEQRQQSNPNRQPGPRSGGSDDPRRLEGSEP